MVRPQEGVGSTSATQTDPKALMLRASELNNLTSEGTKPWHLKASFQLLDEQGNASDEGTYEEFWAGPKKSKYIFAGKAFTQTSYSTDKGEFREPSQAQAPVLLNTARRDLTGPIPDMQTIEHTAYTSKAIQTGSLKLTCVTPAAVLGAWTFCLGPDEPILRIFAQPANSTQILYNRILRFESHAIAGDLKMTRGGKVLLNLHIDKIEPLDSLNEADFVPPPDAVEIPKLVNISGSVALGMLEYRVVPDYPSAAHNAGISGTVLLLGKISKDGHVINLKVVSGPTILQGAAMQAVSQWRYHPYLLNGEPVEVMTTINVIFMLH